MDKMLQRGKPLARLARRPGVGYPAVPCLTPLWQRGPARYQSSRPTGGEGRGGRPLGWSARRRLEDAQGAQHIPDWASEGSPPAVTVRDGWLTVTPAQAGPGHLTAPLAWLRDVCECEHCVSPDSGQRRFATADIPDRPGVASAAVDRGGRLRIEWENDFLAGGPHVSRYRAADLLGGRPPLLVPARLPWDKASLAARLVTVSHADWAADGPAFWRALAALYQTGLVVVDGVPDSPDAVLAAAARIGPVQNTFYGTAWDVVSVPRAANVAYTSDFLGLHQDLLYMRDPPGIQLLHCLRNECPGGESLFADGLRAAWEVRLADEDTPDRRLWPALCEIDVPYAYARAGHTYRFRRPVVRREAGAVADVAWAPPFQDVFDLPGAGDGRGGFARWKEAARAFSDALSAPRAVFEFKLRPGQCVVFDNRRVLHGRREFDTASGHRHLRGTYVAQQDFLSRLQRLPAEVDGVERLPLHSPRGVQAEENLVAAALGRKTPKLSPADLGKKAW